MIGNNTCINSYTYPALNGGFLYTKSVWGILFYPWKEGNAKAYQGRDRYNPSPFYMFNCNCSVELWNTQIYHMKELNQISTKI